MSTDEDIDINLRGALDLNKKILSLCGYWLPVNVKGISKIPHLIYSFLLIGFFYVLYVITEIFNIYMSLDDLSKFAEAAFIFLTHLVQTLKLICFIIYFDRIVFLYNSLNRDIFKPRNLEQYKILKNMLYYSKYSYTIFIVMCLICLLIWILLPILDYTIPDNQLPFNIWYPFDINKSPTFEIVYFYQALAITINAIANLNLDTLASGFMAQIDGQLALLNHALINIKEQSTKNIGKLRFRKETFQKVLQEEMDKELIRCVVHHNNILEMAEEISTIFSLSIFCLFGAACIILCATMLQMTLIEVSGIKLFSLILYIGCVLCELTLYCWYGNQIMIRSSELITSLYSSDWIDCTIAYKKNVLMVMIRTLIPLKLYAGNLFSLSLETLMTILRTSYSFFAVLNQISSN